MRTVPAFLLLAACTAPPELVDDTTADDDLAAASLADVLPLLFRDAEQPLPRVQELVAALEREVAAQGLDLTAEDPAAREYTLEHLPTDRLGEVVPPEGADPTRQTSVVVFGRSTHAWDDAVRVQLEPNQVCIESKSTVYYGRAFATDTGCFADGSCDTLRSVAEVRKELSILAAGWYDFHKDYRRFELPDGRRVLLGRGWIPDVYVLERGGTAWQTYTVEAWVERDGAVDRTYALWGELDLGLPPAAMLDLTSDALHENMTRQDAWAAGTPVEDYCGQDRDRPYDRPTEAP